MHKDFCEDQNLNTQMANSPDSLPEIGENERFEFMCGPEMPCFNRCCADVAIPLTPYDVSRITRNLELSSEDFLKTFTERNAIPETGITLPMLKMIPGPDAPCPFAGPAGCAIYEDRPGACRSWPLGRGSSLGEGGIKQRYYLIRESFCQGFCQGRQYTPPQWQNHEGMATYNIYNDLYMRLSSRIAASGQPLERRLANMCFLALYQLDRFRELISAMKIFSRLELPEERQELIMENSAKGDEAALIFAFDWLDLIIFENAENLGKKIVKSSNVQS